MSRTLCQSTTATIRLLASDSATRTVDSLGGPPKDEHLKTVKCCVKQKAQQGGVEN